MQYVIFNSLKYLNEVYFSAPVTFMYGKHKQLNEQQSSPLGEINDLSHAPASTKCPPCRESGRLVSD